MPPSVKPVPHKTSTQAGILLNDLERVAMGGKSPAIAEALRNLESAIEAQRDAQQKLSAPPGVPPRPPVADGMERPDNGPMEARLTTLESDMRDVRDRLVRVEVKLDGVEKKVDLLPSKDFVVSEVSRSANKIIIWVVIAVGAAQLIPSLAVPLLKHFGI